MPYAAVNELQMHYDHYPAKQPSAGKSPLLLLSGMASDCASWQPIVQLLRRQHELVLPDNRCSGRTTPLPVNTNRALMVADVVALLDALEIDQAIIVGHSMGGMLGWALVSHAPERVSHLISLSALPEVLPARVALFQSLVRLRAGVDERTWFEHLYHFLFSPAFFEYPELVTQAAEASVNYPHKQTAEAFAQQVEALASFAEPLVLDNIDCPVTMLTGSDDILMTPAMQKQFCSSRPQITQTVIAGAAHALHWEQSQMVADYLLAAIADNQ